MLVSLYLSLTLLILHYLLWYASLLLSLTRLQWLGKTKIQSLLALEVILEQLNHAGEIQLHGLPLWEILSDPFNSSGANAGSLTIIVRTESLN